MYCPNCGIMNPEGAESCRFCGKELVEQPSPEEAPKKMRAQKPAPRTPPDSETQPVIESRQSTSVSSVAKADSSVASLESESPKASGVYTPDSYLRTSRIGTDSCPICGRPKDETANLCDYCLEPEEDTSEAVPPLLEEFRGDLEAQITEDMELPKVGGVLIILAGILGMIFGFMTIADVTNTGLPGSVVCFTGLMIVFGLGAIAGGYSAVNKKNAIYAIIGGVLGILSVGFYIGAVLSFIGLILVGISYNQFEESKLTLTLQK